MSSQTCVHQLLSFLLMHPPLPTGSDPGPGPEQQQGPCNPKTTMRVEWGLLCAVRDRTFPQRWDSPSEERKHLVSVECGFSPSAPLAFKTGYHSVVGPLLCFQGVQQHPALPTGGQEHLLSPGSTCPRGIVRRPSHCPGLPRSGIWVEL